MQSVSLWVNTGFIIRYLVTGETEKPSVLWNITKQAEDMWIQFVVKVKGDMRKSLVCRENVTKQKDKILRLNLCHNLLSLYLIG
jgi:hypothetical protein